MADEDTVKLKLPKPDPKTPTTLKKAREAFKHAAGQLGRSLASEVSNDLTGHDFTANFLSPETGAERAAGQNTTPMRSAGADLFGKSASVGNLGQSTYQATSPQKITGSDIVEAVSRSTVSIVSAVNQVGAAVNTLQVAQNLTNTTLTRMTDSMSGMGQAVNKSNMILSDIADMLNSQRYQLSKGGSDNEPRAYSRGAVSYGGAGGGEGGERKEEDEKKKEEGGGFLDTIGKGIEYVKNLGEGAGIAKYLGVFDKVKILGSKLGRLGPAMGQGLSTFAGTATGRAVLPYMAYKAGDAAIQMGENLMGWDRKGTDDIEKGINKKGNDWWHGVLSSKKNTWGYVGQELFGIKGAQGAYETGDPQRHETQEKLEDKVPGRKNVVVKDAEEVTINARNLKIVGANPHGGGGDDGGWNKWFKSDNWIKSGEEVNKSSKSGTMDELVRKFRAGEAFAPNLHGKEGDGNFSHGQMMFGGDTSGGRGGSSGGGGASLGYGGRSHGGGGLRGESDKGGGSVAGSQEVPIVGRALLDTIANSESGKDGYRARYPSKTFDDFSHHPNIPELITSGPNRGKRSSAAGRYQFIKGTWDKAAKALGLKDFSPESQDKAAWWLAKNRYHRETHRDLEKDLQSGDPNIIAGVGRALHGEWTSLPGGIEQGQSAALMNKRFSKHLRTQQEAASKSSKPKVAQEPTKSDKPQGIVAQNIGWFKKDYEPPAAKFNPHNGEPIRQSEDDWRGGNEAAGIHSRGDGNMMNEMNRDEIIIPDSKRFDPMTGKEKGGDIFSGSRGELGNPRDVPLNEHSWSGPRIDINYKSSSRHEELAERSTEQSVAEKTPPKKQHIRPGDTHKQTKREKAAQGDHHKPHKGEVDRRSTFAEYYDV